MRHVITAAMRTARALPALLLLGIGVLLTRGEALSSDSADSAPAIDTNTATVGFEEGLSRLIQIKEFISSSLCRLALLPSAKRLLRVEPFISRAQNLTRAPTLFDLMDIRIVPDQSTRPFGFPLFEETTTGLLFRPIDGGRVVRMLPYKIPGFELMNQGVRAQITPALKQLKPKKKNIEAMRQYSDLVSSWVAEDLVPGFFSDMTETIRKSFFKEFGGDPKRGIPLSWPGQQARLLRTKNDGPFMIEIRGILDYQHGKPMTFSDFFQKPQNYSGAQSLYPITASGVEFYMDAGKQKARPKKGGPYIARLVLHDGYFQMEARYLNETQWHFQTLPLYTLFRRGWYGLNTQTNNPIEPRLSQGEAADGGWTGYLFMMLPHLLLSTETYPDSP